MTFLVNKKMILPDNCYSNNEMKSIDGIIIHYISAVNILPDDPFDLDVIFDIFKRYKVSAHYLIDREGDIIELVPLPKIAWHAGKSRMNGRDGCNNWTVGIELMGGAGIDYTVEQISSIKIICAKLMSEYKISLENIQAHSDVRTAWIESHPNKKVRKKYDPGNKFPWKEFRESLLAIDT